MSMQETRALISNLREMAALENITFEQAATCYQMAQINKTEERIKNGEIPDRQWYLQNRDNPH